ncbi:MAG: NAD(P)-dependent oxidoreductase [Prevotella sp.]|nr:NAD(P)-dependent oxidoreductase [Prevotella sp.]
MTFEKKNILITGASGFIGSFIAEEALRRDMNVWVAVRKSTNRKYLTDPRLRFIELNLGSEEQMKEALSGLHFDYVVHAAGATKCKDPQDFYKVNTEGTKNLVKALQNPAMETFLVYLSSLSIFGAIREEEPHQDILLTDTPQPNTHYGKSKLKAEEWLKDNCTMPYVVLRPTGVYGPRETDYFLMAQSIKQHVDFAAGFKPQDITFVYVRDVVQAVFKAIEHRDTCAGKAYFLSDGEVYSSRTFSDLIQKELGVRFLLRLKAPLWLLRIITIVGDRWGKMTGKVTALNNDKYHILRQRNWKCDIRPAQQDFDFRPEWQLERGVKEAMAWYKENKWL